NNGRRDVFLYDRQTAQISAVSVNSSGYFGSGHSEPSINISSDGRYVVFASRANLVDWSGLQGYLRDTVTGQTFRITRRYTDGGSVSSMTYITGLDVSDDGRYVVFASDGTN
ncbi:MAG TPA: hypothetical protein PLZ51_27320, partial [Aggregatilineales bacterium]|nr:hypothetical protein [Aggregatilineales bacterium]